MPTYFHSIGDDMFAAMMLNNTRLRKGVLPTGELMRPHLPEGCIISPYSQFTAERAKEDVWEEVRASSFPHLPSRNECLFLFENEASFNAACALWWPNQARRKLLVHVIEGSRVHRGDAKWLNAQEADWRNNATAYWSGEATDAPLFELVVQGALFFPDWEKFPMAGMPWAE